MKAKHLIPYLIFAVQARALHKKYNVSASYMEIVLRIEYHCKLEVWSDARYNNELIALARRFPQDWKNHMQGKETDNARTKETEPANITKEQE